MTDFDFLLSVPDGSTITAVKMLVPLTSRTPGMVKFAVGGIATPSRTGTGS